MAHRINHAIELLAQGQAISHDGPRAGPCTGRRGRGHLGRLREFRHGARLVRYGWPCWFGAPAQGQNTCSAPHVEQALARIRTRKRTEIAETAD